VVVWAKMSQSLRMEFLPATRRGKPALVTG